MVGSHYKYMRIGFVLGALQTLLYQRRAMLYRGCFYTRPRKSTSGFNAHVVGSHYKHRRIGFVLGALHFGLTLLL